MATFSKNGKPMGRTPSAAENKNARWSKEEDNYLAIALREHIPASDVAARLGRTKNSIYFRKISLKLEGEFGRSKKPGRQPKARLFQNTSDAIPAGIELMKLESGIPVPKRGTRVNESERNSIRQLLSKMGIGQSFVVTKNMVHVVRFLASKEFEAYKIKASLIAPVQGAERKFFRIFRLA